MNSLCRAYSLLTASVLVLFQSTICSAQNCNNIDFENSAAGTYTSSSSLAGWQLSSNNSSVFSCSSTSYTWVPGCSEFSLLSTPVLNIPVIGTLPNSPLGGTLIAALNSTLGNYSCTRLTKTISVTNASPIVNYALAFVLVDGGSAHSCCAQAKFQVIVRDPGGNIDPCSSVTMDAIDCTNAPWSYSLNTTDMAIYSNWQTQSINLSAYIGNTVTLEVIAWKCNYGGHYGRVFFDAVCGAGMVNCNCTPGSNTAQVNYCAGANQAVINAPAGMNSYSWTSSAQIPAGQSTLSALTIPNPTVGQVYTVSMTSTAGCSSITSYTLVYTNVGAGSFSVAPACGTGASGSATMYPTGSGSGYNFVWVNSSNSVIASSQSAGNLAPGNYTVQISASPGCGSVSTGINISSFSNPSTVFLSGPSSGCNSYSTLASVGFSWWLGPNAFTFSWTPSLYLNSQSGQTAVITPTCAAGTSVAVIYTVVVTPTAYPHCAETKTLQVTVGDPSAPTLQPVSAQCLNGASVQLNGLPAGGNYLSGSAALTGSGVFTPSLSTAGTYTYAYAINSGGCTKSTKDSIKINAPPVLTISGNTAICLGSSAALIVSGADTYTWNNSSHTPSMAVSPTVNSTYSVSGTHTSSGCRATNTIQVSVYPIPTVTISGPDSVCAGAPFVLQGGGAASYSWQNSAITSSVLLNFPAGQHQFSVTGFSSPANCKASAIHSVFAVNIPTVQIAGISPVCEGDLVTLTATGANSYSWSNGASGPSFSVIAGLAATYSVTGYNVTMCQDSDIFSLSVDLCLGLDEAKTANPRIFPNPTNGVLNFVADREGYIVVMDCQYRIVKQEKISSGASAIQLSELLPGIYILNYSSFAESLNFKILKN